MRAVADGVEVVVHASEWPGEASGRVEGQPIERWRREAREALGLADRPVIAAGHQSECWHAGILAKPLWVQALARRESAQAVHLVVDQDAFDGMFVEWPWRRPDGWWGVRGHRFAPADARVAGLRAAPLRPRAIEPGEGVEPQTAEALARLQRSLATHADAPDAAMQGARAMLELAHPWLEAPAVVRASALLGTTFGRRLLDRMLEAPEACAVRFNEALAQNPRAARPLRVQGSRSELPVWLLGELGERLRGDAEAVRTAIAARRPVLPRAFLMSAIARTALAERFVHGLGGAVYERVTDHWMRAWLGWTPPAFDVASASVRLALGLPSQPAEPTVPFRRAWCDPDLLDAGGTGPSAARRAAIEMIASLPPRDPRRRAAFQDLLADRNAARLRRSGELDALMLAEQAAGAARLTRELAARRTWCFTLLDPARVAAMRDAIERHAGA